MQCSNKRRRGIEVAGVTRSVLVSAAAVVATAEKFSTSLERVNEMLKQDFVRNEMRLLDTTRQDVDTSSSPYGILKRLFPSNEFIGMVSSQQHARTLAEWDTISWANGIAEVQVPRNRQIQLIEQSHKQWIQEYHHRPMLKNKSATK